MPIPQEYMKAAEELSRCLPHFTQCSQITEPEATCACNEESTPLIALLLSSREKEAYQEGMKQEREDATKLLGGGFIHKDTVKDMRSHWEALAAYSASQASKKSVEDWFKTKEAHDFAVKHANGGGGWELIEKYLLRAVERACEKFPKP